MERKLKEVKENISKQKEIVEELKSFSKIFKTTKNPEEKKMIASQIENLKRHLKKTNDEGTKKLKEVNISKPLIEKEGGFHEKILPNNEEEIIPKKIKIRSITKLEEETIKRLKNKEEKTPEKKIRKPSEYVRFANKIFSKRSFLLSKKTIFKELERDLIKSNLQFILPSYISVILLTTAISIIFAILLFLFFLFFNVGPTLPIVTFVEGSTAGRIVKIFWILFVIPIATFLIMYFYPSLERKSTENKINQELPFATIHMAAISGSMVEPTKIFSIIISTGEYPYLEKEFTKIMNEINIYGYNLIDALRNVSFNSPSKKLSELLNGLSTTITSGGNLPQFFDKRAQTLMFEHRLEREKYTKYAETFMDIYISVVIAAPMILMLLLIMMKVSGLGISLSTSMIALIMVMAVSIINIFFLTFLHLKQPAR